MKQAYIEAFKEMMRVVLLAVIPLLIDNLGSGEFNWRLIWVTAAIAGLRFVDSMLHEYGKRVGSTTLSKGLTRF